MDYASDDTSYDEASVEMLHQSPTEMEYECADWIQAEKCQESGCIRANLGIIRYCDEHAPSHTGYNLHMQFLHGGLRATSVPPLLSTNDPRVADSPSLERSSATGHSRISYRKTKTVIENPAGYESRLHSDLNIQCGLVYGPSTNPELQGKLCGRWFRDTAHYNAHVKLLQGHNLHVGKNRPGQWVCTWSGCGNEMPAKEMWRHITAFHVGARYRCKVCGHTTGPRIDHITNHLSVKHALGTNKDIVRTWYEEIYA